MPSVFRSTGPNRLIKSFNFTAAASATTNHTVGLFVNNDSSWFFVNVIRNSDSAQMSFQMPVVKLLSGDPEDQRFSILGEDLVFTFKAKLSGSDLIFEVVNSETSELAINYIRIRR